jgi:site-specific DNA recombinase
MVVRVGIYIRISRAKRELLDAQRQLPPCEAFCQQQGWQVVEVYTDDNRSAWKQGIRRDNFERLLTDVRAGKIDAIVSWQMDRLLRTVEDASALIAIARKYKTVIANIGGTIDLNTADGRKRLYELAVAAYHESDLKSERLALKHAELAAEGHWQGGPRPFGYDLEPYPDIASGRVKYNLVINQAEAAAIQRAKQDVLEGRGAAGITRQWGEEGVRSTTGKFITPTKVREILVSPRIAALRNSGGKLVDADWPAIITRDEHLELKAILGPQRRDRPGGQLPTARRYLLGGFVVCGICAHRLSAKPWQKQGGRRIRRHFCDPKKGGCGGVARSAEPIERWVTWQLLMEAPRRLLEATKRAPAEWETLGRLMTARQTEEDRLEGFADFLADGTWDRPTYLRQKRRVQARIAKLDGEISHVRATRPRRRLRGTTMGELRAEWDRLDLDDKRALLADYIIKIVVKPVGAGRRAFNPDSIEIHWQES